MRVSFFPPISRLFLPGINPSFLIGISMRRSIENCTLHITVKHQWFELGTFWAAPGLPEVEYKQVYSLKDKYPIHYLHRDWLENNYLNAKADVLSNFCP